MFFNISIDKISWPQNNSMICITLFSSLVCLRNFNWTEPLRTFHNIKDGFICLLYRISWLSLLMIRRTVILSTEYINIGNAEKNTETLLNLFFYNKNSWLNLSFWWLHVTVRCWIDEIKHIIHLNNFQICFVNYDCSNRLWKTV